MCERSFTASYPDIRRANMVAVKNRAYFPYKTVLKFLPRHVVHVAVRHILPSRSLVVARP